ncbi:PREDICTED: uncharacterized protein LOC105954352 [Erythranthe guttata]|uniref:uncharacterized protein LOC105954352 n=1 Tax=Erythranthe guttata TaxID=4155 RepID=UPI00064DA309|nr:PREDICTED: uncharacterized protein LOC105954352 [Erythranthe guttata]|eukprot:XP_012833477.1 PREDICTED: uncharacterized protein LOC105954352 [Erythranthe guttata]
MVNPVRGRARTIASSSRATQPSVQLSGESVTGPQESLSALREEDTIQQAHTDSTSSITKKNVRGCTRGIALRKLNSKNKQKLVVHMDPTQGRPLDSLESAKLSSELGIISRDSMSVPIKWKAIDDTELSMAIDLLEMNLTIDNLDEETVENALEILKHRSRYQRHRLNKHFKKFDSVEEAIRNKPSFGGLTQQNWESLCTNLFSDQKYKVQSFFIYFYSFLYM